MTKFFLKKIAFFPEWEVLKKIRKKVLAKLKVDRNIAEETKLVVSELCENAIKYSDKSKENKIILEIEVNENKISICVTNNFMAESDLLELKEKINKINSSINPEELYVNQIFYLAQNPNVKKSQLGIYRIIYETKYKLGYEIFNGSVKVIASRDLNKIGNKDYAAI